MGNKRDEGNGKDSVLPVYRVGWFGRGNHGVSKEAMSEEEAETFKQGHRANGNHAVKMERTRGKHGG